MVSRRKLDLFLRLISLLTLSQAHRITSCDRRIARRGWHVQLHPCTYCSIIKSRMRRFLSCLHIAGVGLRGRRFVSEELAGNNGGGGSGGWACFEKCHLLVCLQMISCNVHYFQCNIIIWLCNVVPNNSPYLLPAIVVILQIIGDRVVPVNVTRAMLVAGSLVSTQPYRGKQRPIHYIPQFHRPTRRLVKMSEKTVFERKYS